MPPRLKDQLYPKLPKLNSSDIVWDDDDWRPSPVPGVMGSQILSSTTQNSGVRQSKAQLGLAAKTKTQSIVTFYSPTANVMAYFVGLCVHLLHCCLHSHRMYTVAKCDCSWEKFPSEENGEAMISLDLGCVVLIIASLILGYFISKSYTTYRLSGCNRTIWLPNEFALTVFCVYSPAHAVLWMVTTWGNCMLMGTVMFLLSKQMIMLSRAYRKVVNDIY